MPPIPLRQHAFSDPDVTLAISSLQQREGHLASSAIPHLTTLSPSTPLSDQQRLSSELHEELDDFGRRVEGLEQLVEDLRNPSERQTGRDVVHQWADTYAELKKKAREAMLVSKRNIDQHAKSRRDELIGSAVLARQGQMIQDDSEKAEDALMQTTATLTDALRRTEARLRAELDRSILSTQLLTSQTASLRQTSDAHGRLGGLLDTSKGLITALERTDWLDRILILGALVVFLLACAWIIKVRVFDRAMGIAFWWVKFLPSPAGGTGETVIERLEKGAKATGGTISSVEKGATTALASAVTAATGRSSLVLSKATETMTTPVGVDAAVPQLHDGLVETLLDNVASATTAVLSQATKQELSLPTQTLVSMFRDEL